MTPEEKVIEIAIKIDCHPRRQFIIAEALRTARLEALEEAARVADKYWGGGMPEDAVGESMLNASYDIATAIRALKGET